MAITLGKAGAAPPVGTNIITASFTEECETIDVSNRDNVGGATGAPGYRAFLAGFTSRTWEIECHDPTGLAASLIDNTGPWEVMSVTENIGVDGAVTFTVTAREL